MSYNIAVVNFRLPDDFKEACAVVNRLSAEDIDTIDPAYVEFHQRVTEIFPCICDLPDDQVDDGVWCDGPLINNFESKAPVIGFVYSKVEEALPPVVNLAIEMGLSVLDWQSETVYNPEGTSAAKGHT